MTVHSFNEPYHEVFQRLETSNILILSLADNTVNFKCFIEATIALTLFLELLLL